MTAPFCGTLIMQPSFRGRDHRGRLVTSIITASRAWLCGDGTLLFPPQTPNWRAAAPPTPPRFAVFWGSPPPDLPDQFQKGGSDGELATGAPVLLERFPDSRTPMGEFLIPSTGGREFLVPRYWERVPGARETIPKRWLRRRTSDWSPRSFGKVPGLPDSQHRYSAHA